MWKVRSPMLFKRFDTVKVCVLPFPSPLVRIVFCFVLFDERVTVKFLLLIRRVLLLIIDK